MDFEICFGLALVETLITSALSPTSKPFSDLPTNKTLLFLSFFSVQWLVIKFYRVFIYPNFFSPLRGIPGPKVLKLPFPRDLVIFTNHMLG